MEIRVTREGGIRLLHDDDFKSFAVTVEADASRRAFEALARFARVEGGEHAWIRPAKLRDLTPRSGDTAWEQGLLRMIAYAGTKGWIDGDGAIRAHIETIDQDHLPAVDAAEFKAAMRNLAGGVVIVATGSGEERRGMTVSAVTSVSAEPPCLLVCINRTADSHDTIAARGAFSVNLLDVRHRELAMRFAGLDGTRGAQRFDMGSWNEGALDVPVLDDALCAMECELISSSVIGSHSLFVGRIIGTRNRTGIPLVNFQGGLHVLEAA